MAAITSTPAKSNPKLNELHVPVGETLFRAGERADSVFVITRGEMGIFASDGATLIATLSTGASFGEQAVVGTKHRMATAKAITDAVCLEIPSNMLAGEIDKASPKLKQAFDALTLQLLVKNFVTEMSEVGQSSAEFSVADDSPGALALKALESNRAVNSIFIDSEGTINELIKSGRGVVITDGEVMINKNGIRCRLRRGGVLGVAEVIANVECRDAFHLVRSVNALSIDGDSAFQAFSQLSPGLKGVVKGLIKRALGADVADEGRV